MTTYEKVLKRGRWLVLRKRWLFVAAIVCCVGAVLVATPFRMAHGAWLTVAAILLAAAGVAMRALAAAPAAARRALGEQGPPLLPDLIDARGIFSVTRFPSYTANLLLIAALVVYTGVGWFAIAAIMVCYTGTYCIIMAQEHILQSRYGDVFAQWCKTTQALYPALLSWQPWTIRTSYVRLILAQGRAIFAMTLGFCLIDLCKNWVIDFSFTVSLPWLAALAAAFALLLATRRFGR